MNFLNQINSSFYILSHNIIQNYKYCSFDLSEEQLKDFYDILYKVIFVINRDLTYTEKKNILIQYCKNIFSESYFLTFDKFILDGKIIIDKNKIILTNYSSYYFLTLVSRIYIFIKNELLNS